MKINRTKYLLFALLILQVGCSELLTAPEESNITDRPITRIAFRVFEQGHVLLYITNYNFEIVRIIIDEELEAGDHYGIWDGRDYNNDSVASGVYNAFIITNDYSNMLQMLLIK